MHTFTELEEVSVNAQCEALFTSNDWAGQSFLDSDYQQNVGTITQTVAGVTV